MRNALEITALNKTYQNGVIALKEVSFSVEEGDFYALLGPNGAGKSTTIGIITSLVNKTGGKVKIFNYDIDDDFSSAKRYLGVMPQEFNFSIFESCLNVLVFQAGYYGILRKEAFKRAERLLEQLGLYEARNRQVRMLSGGMKRRLMIARALMHEPRLLILDEPTAGVDIELRRLMWSFLTEINQKKGITIILTTHYLEEAERLCKHITILDKGSIIEQSDVKSLLQQLHTETFILDITKPLSSSFQLNGFTFEKVDDLTLAVDVKKTQDLNSLFSLLTAEGITVTSLRNKANRLEELFLKLTAKKGTL